MIRRPRRWPTRPAAVPPCAETISAAIARPRPEPGSPAGLPPGRSARRDAVARPGATPGPSSLTSMTTWPPAADAVIAAGGGGRGMHEHVREKVIHGPAHQFLVADRDQAAGDPHLPGPAGVGDPRPLGAPGDHGGHVDGLLVPVRLLAEPGQPQHVIDEPAHAPGLEDDPLHDLVDVLRAAQGALLVQLGIGAQRGQRGAQLVAGVREELPHLLLAGLALVHVGLDPGQHAVQGGAQPARPRCAGGAEPPAR